MIASRAVCVFCGTTSRADEKFIDLARTVGTRIAERRMRLVYGGNTMGMTGALADGAIAAKGHVTGVIPAPLFMLANRRIDDLRLVASMHERKRVMAQESDAFVALPGGFGTLDEVFELATWRQVGLHSKPIALLNVGGFFDPLLEWQRRALAEGFVTELGAKILEPLADLDALERWLDAVPRLGSWVAPERILSKWTVKLRDKLRR